MTKIRKQNEVNSTFSHRSQKQIKTVTEKAAKERRQKIINENRETQKNEENNEEKGKIENSEGKRKIESKVYKELVGMIKQVADGRYSKTI